METSPTTLRYRPGLDGLRGLAVLAVLAYHHDGWLPGGFLGVSAFFTLSGFLITWLLAAEHDTTGSIDLRRFWGRRARRLLPASWLALLGIVILGAATGIGGGRLIGDVWAALANVANWRFVLEGSSYGALFEDPSPVAHYWSLAIEEQLYLVVPLLLLAVLGHRNVRLAVLAALVLGSLAVSIAVDGDRAYHGTDTRAAEVLIGSLAALVITDPRFRPAPIARRAAAIGGVVALPALFVLWATTSLTDPNLHRGLLVGHALLTVAVIAACLVAGPLRAVLSLRPLVVIGKVSYGLYLFHWPVFLWLDRGRTGLDGAALLAVRVAVSGALTGASYLAVEQPVRLRRVLRSPAQAAAGIAGALAVLAAVVVLAPTTDTPSTADDLATAAETLERAESVAPPAPPGTADDGVTAPVRIVVFGDSTALMTAAGLQAWAERNPELAHVTADARLGCPVVRGGKTSFDPGQPGDVLPECNERDRLWRAHLEANPSDVAVLQYGPWDVAERLLPGDDTWRTIGDPAVDGRLRDEMHAAVDLLVGEGVAEVVWLTAPYIEALSAQRAAPGQPHPSSDDARMDRFNEILRDVAEERPDDLTLVDLNGYLADHPDGAPGGRLRPDGIHFTAETTVEVATTWLGDQILTVSVLG